MALPSFLSDQLKSQGQISNIPIGDAAERSKSSDEVDTWAPSGGPAAEENTTADQAFRSVVMGSLAYGTYKFLPNLFEGISTEVEKRYNQSIPVIGLDSANKKVGDVLGASSGKKVLSKLLRLGLTSGASALDGVDFQSEKEFWYSGLTKLGNRGVPIFDNVSKLFTRATYLADILSYSTVRNSKTDIFLNISSTSLGVTGKQRTIDLYQRQFGLSDVQRKNMEFMDFLVYRNGDIHQGILSDGGVLKVGKKIETSVKARLVDKGKVTEGLLTILDETLGIKNRATGGTLAETIGGREDYLLLSAGEIDVKLGDVLQGLGQTTTGKITKKLLGMEQNAPGGSRLRKFSNPILLAESYTTHALQRTSNLMSELSNEVGSFFEYLYPDVKQRLSDLGVKGKLMPVIQHGHGFAMLGRYSRLATGVAAGLTGLNQIGWSMQNGNPVTSTVAGGIQATALAMGGAMLSSRLRKGTLPGFLIGGTFGIAGMAGMGPFANGPIPGIANVFARANELRSYIGEATLLSSWRRKVEEAMPGASEPTTALGVGFVAGSIMVHGGRFLSRETIVEEKQRAQYLRNRFGAQSERTMSLQNKLLRAEMEIEDSPIGRMFQELQEMEGYGDEIEDVSADFYQHTLGKAISDDRVRTENTIVNELFQSPEVREVYQTTNRLGQLSDIGEERRLAALRYLERQGRIRFFEEDEYGPDDFDEDGYLKERKFFIDDAEDQKAIDLMGTAGEEYRKESKEHLDEMTRATRRSNDVNLLEIEAHVKAENRQLQQGRQEIAMRRQGLSQPGNLRERAVIASQVEQLKEQNDKVIMRRVRPDRGERPLNPRQVERIQGEIISHINDLKKKGEFAALNNPLNKTRGDASGFSALAERITQFSDERMKESLLKGERSVLNRLKAAIDYAPRTRAIGYATAAIGGLWYLLTTGLVGTKETPQELRDLNKGKRLEVVRRNQKWEMGQGGYEGDDALYYRPTLTARLSSGATQSGASGNHGPVAEFFLKNFTYKLERENYWKRPTPITGAAFDQVPFIYPFIQPLADLIKAPKLMHVGEWARAGKDRPVEFLERTTGMEETPDMSIPGATPMAAPVSPYSTGRVMGKLWQQTTALGGLVGYFARTAKAALTGTGKIGAERSELESFSNSMDVASRFYDLHGGGSVANVPFTSEVVRRFLFKSEAPQYNPIRNTLPSWMPKNLTIGNPYSSTRHGGGEYRMPGEGYSALHKELKGLDPENYPLLHKLNILGDVAPYSSEYRSALRQSEIMKNEGDMGNEELKFFYRHKQNVKAKKDKREYDNYVFRPSTFETLSGTVTSVDPESLSFTLSGYGGRFGVAGISNDSSSLISDFNMSVKQAAKQRVKNKGAFSEKLSVGTGVTVQVPKNIGSAVDEEGIIKAAVSNNGFNVNKDIREEGKFASDRSEIAGYAMSNAIGKTAGRLWEATTHFANRMAQPIEHIMAFGASPVNKLLPYRDALEDYEAREMYGTEMKGWESPIAGWIAPAIKTAARNYLGLEFESPRLSEKRDTEEYFDKLKYVKYRGLTQSALDQGNTPLAMQYENVASQTAVGSSGWVSKDSIGSTLGGRESLFAQGFANEINLKRQADILEALPEFKRHLMEGYYLNRDLEAINRAASAGPMSTTGMEYASDLLTKKSSQGYEGELNADQVNTNRKREVENYFEHKTMPRVDWIGFNPAVDLEDVKLKYIQNEGMDYHDFGIYPSRASYMSRKHYIDEKSVQDLNNLAVSPALTSFADVAKAYGQRGSISYNIQGPSRTQSFVDLSVNNTVGINPFADLG
jgi:hypothetical protein